MVKKEDKEYILECTRALLEVCDGARTEDGKGFNKFDAKFVRDLMEQYETRESLSLRQWHALSDALMKYKNQLSRMEYTTLRLKDIDFKGTAEEDKVKIEVRENKMVVDTPYNRKWLNEFKREIRKDNRTWNNEGKVWLVDIYDLEVGEKVLDVTEKYFDVDLDVELPDVTFGTAKIGEFGIIFDTQYDEEFIQKVKSFRNRDYDDENKTWEVKLMSVDEVEKVESILDEWDIDVYPEVYEHIEDKWDGLKKEKERHKKLVKLSRQKSLKSEYDVDLPSDDLTLRPFQKFGVKMLDLREKGLIADEMGLGKTIQVLAHLYNKPDRRPVIVVVPSSVKFNWRREIIKWTEASKEDVQILKGENGRVEGGKDWYIVNYAILHHRLDSVEKVDCEALIVDESHYIKNRDALRTEATKNLGRSIKHIYCLTGTPMPNRPAELWQQLEILEPREEDFQSFWSNGNTAGFARKYCGAKQTRWGWDVNGATNLDELQRKLRENIMIRRKKKDVLDELPEKQRFKVSMNLENRNEYKQAVNNFRRWMRNEDKANGDWGKAEVMVKIEKLKQLAWEGKYENMVEWIENVLTQVDKLVVFAHHQELQSKLYSDFEEDAVQLIGGMSSVNRQKVIDEFTENDEVKLMVASIKAAGTGINLQVASTAVFTEIGWTPSEHNQAEDRIHRMGQEDESVNIYYLMAEDTIEGTTFRAINEKQKIIDEAIDGVVDDDKKGVMMEVLEEEEILQDVNSKKLSEFEDGERIKEV